MDTASLVRGAAALVVIGPGGAACAEGLASRLRDAGSSAPARCARLRSGPRLHAGEDRLGYSHSDWCMKLRQVRDVVDLSRAECGVFAGLFDMGVRATKRLAERHPERALHFGHLGTPRMSEFRQLFAELERGMPTEVRSPFEGSDAIAGGAWLGRKHFGVHPDCALAKLCFSAGAVDLPMHSHEHSDRFILVLEGEGRFHHAPGSPQGFTGAGVRSAQVSAGDLVLFRRGLVHTFSSPRRAMTLLSWHAPYFPFVDPRQFSLPAARVCPDLTDSN